MGWDMRVQLRPLAMRVRATLRTSKRPLLYLSVVFKAVSHAVRNSVDLTPYGRIASSFWSSCLCLPGAETTSLHTVHEVPYGVQAFVNVRQAHHQLSYVPNNAFCVSRWWRTHHDLCRSHQFCWGQAQRPPSLTQPSSVLFCRSDVGLLLLGRCALLHGFPRWLALLSGLQIHHQATCTS